MGNETIRIAGCDLNEPGRANRKQGGHSRRVRQQVFGVFLIQAVTAIVLVISLLWIAGKVFALSAFGGAAVYLVPNLYFASRALRFSQGQTARRALAEMYVSQIWKMGLSMVGFMAVFILLKPVDPFSLFGTFILLQLTGWLAQWKLNKRFLKL